MKIFAALIGTLALVFIIVQLYAWKSQRNIETYPYEVLKKYDKFEIRNYESRLFSTVKLPSSQYQKVSGKGFSILAGYIFGGNDQQEKIAMTSPVAITLEDSMTMMFMVPQAWNDKTLPKPNSEEIKFSNEPAKTVAAVTFDGWADQEKIDYYKSMLIKLLQQEKISHTNRFCFLGYNAPYETYNRRNEIIVELSEYPNP